jgi:hypothetical protein
MAEDSNQITDTHMSKKYNDVIYECMIQANASSLSVSSSPHFSLLNVYFSAVESFYTNTFFLFETVSLKSDKESVNLAKALHGIIEQVKENLSNMRNKQESQNDEAYYDTLKLVKYAHQMIMYGLQARNMLVRMSNRELRGEESIDYWGNLKSFEKGHVMNDQEVSKLKQKY